MNAVRRTATVLGLAALVIAGTSIPAGAAFTDSAGVPATVATASVAAPASVTVNVHRCRAATPDATISWPASTTQRGVTGYRVTAYLNNGTSAVVAQTTTAPRTVTITADRDYLLLQPRVTVTTLTSYGWSAESAPSEVISC